MTINVIMGIWKNAPFQSSIISSVDRLNKFLEERQLDIKYDIMRLGPEELSDNMVLPHVFILDGGEDIDPGRYGQQNKYSYFSKPRDEIEFGFAKFMANHDVKMSGVCRGHQLLNVFLGGTLHQDIRQEGIVPRGTSHKSGHKVKLGGGRGSYSPTRNLALGDFVGLHSFSVSSLHHQSINHYGKNVVPSLVWQYYANDHIHRINEGIETTNSMIRGVQSHPEFKGYAKDGLLFAYLMFLDYFSIPLMKITDDDVIEKFKSLIDKKKQRREMESGQFVNMRDRSDGIDSVAVREEYRRSGRRLRRDNIEADAPPSFTINSEPPSVAVSPDNPDALYTFTSNEEEDSESY